MPPPRATSPKDENEGGEEKVEGDADEGEDSNRDPRKRGLGRTCCSTSTRRHQDRPRATRRSGNSARCSAQRRPGIMLNPLYRGAMSSL